MTLPVAHGASGFASSHYAGDADITITTDASEAGNETVSPAPVYAGARSKDDLRQQHMTPPVRCAGRPSGVQLPRPRSYNWPDDARKSYRQACDMVGVRLRNARRRIVAALKRRAQLPIIEIAERIE